ncbi:hypothetical protein Pfo_020558 [Paulownia fortunei]|nr:hypothetical protein Pfo_020558 [Paulownia fortunei]
MEEDQEHKHICKFCNKSFPCGRSLGGHMRSHLINISSADHQKTNEKLPKKKLPPLVNGKSNCKTDFIMEGGGQFGCGLRENPKKTSKFSKSSEEDTLLQEKLCKECGKSFQSWKALFGHMKCHSVNGKMANSMEEDYWNSSNDHQKLIMDSQSDNEAATPLFKRKRSDRMKRDKGDWGGINSVVESSDNSPEFLEANKIAETLDKDSNINGLKFKKLRNGKLETTIINSELKSVKQLELKSLLNGLNTRKKLEVSSYENRIGDKFENTNLDIGGNESEVNSPKNLIKEGGYGQFKTDIKKNKSRKRKCIDAHDSELSVSVEYKKLPLAHAPSDSELCQDFDTKSKFTCSICKKAFPSYQALGGHRASHKKFKGCCAPRSENSPETEHSHNKSANSKLIKCSSSENLIGVSAAKAEAEVGWKKYKDHECPICFKVFSSGQALGGHKRSHLIGDQAKNNPSVETQKPIREIRNFLDLNLPAPAEAECNDFKPWWFGTSHKQEPLLGLLSS